MKKALIELLKHYISLVDSGDCGNWDPREEKVVKNAQLAIQKHEKGFSDQKEIVEIFFNKEIQFANSAIERTRRDESFAMSKDWEKYSDRISTLKESLLKQLK